MRDGETGAYTSQVLSTSTAARLYGQGTLGWSVPRWEAVHPYTKHSYGLSLRHTHTHTRSSSPLFSALSLLITSNVTGRVFPPHCWELLPGFWTSQLPGNKPLPCNTDGTPLQCSARACAPTYTLQTPVRLHVGRSPIPTHRTSDSPQLLARHYFEEASLSFTSYSS